MQALNKLTDTDGIVAACAGQRGALVFSFRDPGATDEERRCWQDIFQTGVELLELAKGHDEIRVVLPQHTVLLRRVEEDFVAAAVHKGHPVVKSLQRMVRRTIKHVQRQPSRPPEASRPADPSPASEATHRTDAPSESSI